MADGLAEAVFVFDQRHAEIPFAGGAETAAGADRDIGFFEQHKTVGAWCELRQDYRHFRIDRIATLAATGERAPKRRHALLKEWRERMQADNAARN